MKHDEARKTEIDGLRDGQFTGKVVTGTYGTVIVALESKDRSGNSTVQVDNYGALATSTGRQLDLTNAIKDDGKVSRMEVMDALRTNSIEPTTALDRLPSMNEEVKLNMARHVSRRQRDTSHTVARQSDEEPQQTALRRSAEKPFPLLPHDIEQTYIRIGNAYHYSHKPELAAFLDKGDKLETKFNGQQVAIDLVRIAQAREWTEIRVRGTEEFRRYAWLAASEQGLIVKGYSPSEADKAGLEKRLRAAQENTIERSIGPQATEATPSAKPQKMTFIRPNPASAAEHSKPVNEAVERPAAHTFSGVLLAHGAATYDFEKNGKDSYFVRIKDDAGKEQLIWGVDLERAMNVSNAQIGQKIALDHKGKTLVTVPTAVRDEAGKVIGTKMIETHRNAWEVKAEAFRSDDEKKAVREHPELVHAYAMVRAAELVADKKWGNHDQDSQRRFVEMTKDTIATNMVRDQTIPEVAVKDRQQQVEQRREVNHERSI